MKIKEVTENQIIIDSEKGYSIKLIGSAMSYLNRDDDGGVSFDFNPTNINVYAMGLDTPKLLYSLYNIKVDNIFGNDIITGYKDKKYNGAPTIINFENFKLFEADHFDCVESTWNLYIK